MKEQYAFYENERNASLKELVIHSANLYGDAVAVRFKRNKSPFQKTYQDILKDSTHFAKILLSQPQKPHHIAVLGPSSYEWIITYLAAAMAGLVIVPLDRKLSSEDLKDLLVQADVDCLVYDEASQKKAQEILEDKPILNFSMQALTAMPAVEISLPEIDPNALFEIVFTSGTTGKSKGVMLTQNNIASNVWQGLGAVRVKHGKDVILSVLPFNHTYEFTCTILGMLSAGVTICLCSGIRYVQKEMQEYAPTLMFIVPMLAEKLYKKIEKTVKKQNKEKLFYRFTKLNAFLYRHHMNLSNLFLKEVHAALGGKLRTLMCGGAPLEEDLIAKFNGIGINLFQGYGLTECSPLLSVNFDYYHRPNSVGKIVPECEVKIVDGEIWARGVSISKGYYNDPQATKESFHDGWFKTGDLGTVDEDNFLFITGRKKNLILLSNGENVSAEELEALLYKIPFISEALVYDENHAITAELYIEETDTKITQEMLRVEIDKVNRNLPYYKRIRKIKRREVPFEKTTSAKIKRIQPPIA